MCAAGGEVVVKRRSRRRGQRRRRAVVVDGRLGKGFGVAVWKNVGEKKVIALEVKLCVKPNKCS